MKTLLDVAFQAKVDAITNAMLDFFFLWQVAHDCGDDWVTMLVLTLDVRFYLNGTFLGIMRLDGLTFLGEGSM